MFGGIFFASGPFAGGLVRVTAAAINLAANVTISVTASASLPPTHFDAAATITITARGDLVVPIVTTPGISIDGVPVTGRVRLAGVTIRDILNDAPNTCTFTIEGAAPIVGQSVRVIMGNRLLFAGAVQTVDASYESKPTQLAWHLTAIDDTGAANARRPFGTWIGASATEIAQSLTATFAPGFSPAGIALGLPPVTIVFDGADTFIACLARLATAVGGYCKVDDHVVYLFTEDTANPPQPIDETHRFLASPPIAMNTDSSQLRTRVYGKGYGETVPADLAAGETLIPIRDGVMFPPAGGTAIVGLTADGAQSDKIAFTGVALTTGGTLVGPGAGPTTALGVSLSPGTGIETGLHNYAAVFVTPTGKSLPGPLAPITVGQVAAPVAAPTAGTPIVGAGVDAGTHRYYPVFRTAAGATTPGPASNAITTSAATGAPVLPSPGCSALVGTGLTLSSGYHYMCTFRRASDGAETSATYAGQAVLFPSNPTFVCAGVRVVTPPAGYTQIAYRTAADAANTPANYQEIQTPTLEGPFPDGYMYLVDHNESRKAKTLPGSNATAVGVVPVTGIPVSPNTAVVTHVDLYREVNNAGPTTARLAFSVTNGTTSANDATANASLGALVPATNTTSANRVAVTWPAGPASVTNIELYRTALGASQLKLVYTVGSNTPGSTIDATPDASLGANAPTGDTSGLQQPQGQVNPGATVLPVASSAVFRSGGGWVYLSGGQVVRYSAISGLTLTGIPAAGSGAITTTVLYGSQAIPAPMLVGVTGLTKPMLKGSAVHIWIQRDDLAAQAEQAARAGGDGVVEFLIVDDRRGVPSLTALCDADLARFARPIVTVAYATRDLNTKSGKTVDIDLVSPAIVATLTIQEVTITEIGIAPGLAPRYTVNASSVRFSLEDTLRRLIAAGPIVGGSS